MQKTKSANKETLFMRFNTGFSSNTATIFGNFFTIGNTPTKESINTKMNHGVIYCKNKDIDAESKQ